MKLETWHEVVKRVASAEGLEMECLSAYDSYVTAGDNSYDAAWCALYDWDCITSDFEQREYE